MPAIFFPPFPLGVAARSITQTDSRTDSDSTGPGTNVNFNSVSVGAAQAGTLIYVLAWHGRTSSSPGTPSCTVGGNNTTRRTFDTTGDGISKAIGTSVFEVSGVSLGGSQNIVISNSISSGIPMGIVVLRTLGYSFGSASSEAGLSTDGSITVNVGSGGAVIGISGNGDGLQSDQNWTNLTRRGNGTFNGVNNKRTWGWDTNLAANASYPVSVSPWSAAQGLNSMSVVVLNKV